ncbi:hypothetical protein ACQ4PT_013229 [Festuca glaucescens]
MVMAAGQYYHHYAKLKVSYRGEIERSSQGGQPKYNGGDNKLIKVPRSISLLEFHDRLAVIAGCFKVAIQYVSPSDTQHALRDVVTSDDLRQLLDWALLQDLQINLPGAKPSNEFVSHVRVFVVRVDVPPPLPESLFSSAPTTPVPPPCLNKRSASAPSLSANPADDTSNPPSPSVIQRSASASASTLTQPSTEDDTKTSTTTTGVPVVPVLVYQPVIQVYQGVAVSAGYLAWFSCAPLKTD